MTGGQQLFPGAWSSSEISATDTVPDLHFFLEHSFTAHRSSFRAS